MPSNREAYFYARKLNVPKTVINFALQEVNGFNHLELTKHFDDKVKNYRLFLSAIDRYRKGEMIEYIFKKAYFLATPFYVNKYVLIPRQETEDLVLKTFEFIDKVFGNKKISIADVCTGSGCIGISIAKKLPNNKYYFTDISKGALRVAKNNAESLLEDVDYEMLQGDMLEPLKGKKVDVIVCNPPYISDTKTIDKRTWEQEPHLALLAKPSTFFYEKVLSVFRKHVNEKFLLAFEIGEDMVDEFLDWVLREYCSCCKCFFENDMYGKPRFLFIINNDV